MTEDKPNKDSGVTVRVPEWLLDELEKELANMPRPRPTRGELLAKAWKDAKAGHPECDHDVEMLRELKRIGEPRRVAALRENIFVFLDNARRALAARKRKGI